MHYELYALSNEVIHINNHILIFSIPRMDVVFNLLVRSYQNEKSTKETLPYEEDLMEYLKTNLPKQISYAQSIKQPSIFKFIYEQEIERLKYFMNGYLITRMEKMNENHQINKDFLSKYELEYYEKIIGIYKREDVFIEDSWQNNEFVGIISNVDGKQILVDGESLELQAGEFLIVPLKDIIDLVYSNDVFLI